MRRAFALVDGRTDFPELVALFKQVRAYQGTGMAATPVLRGPWLRRSRWSSNARRPSRPERAEGRAVAVEGGSRGPRRPERPSTAISRAPVLRGARTPRVHGADEAEGRVLRRRTAPRPRRSSRTRASSAPSSRSTPPTEPIAHIARAVGYRKPGAFAETFRRRTGVPPAPTAAAAPERRRSRDRRGSRLE